MPSVDAKQIAAFVRAIFKTSPRSGTVIARATAPAAKGEQVFPITHYGSASSPREITKAFLANAQAAADADKPYTSMPYPAIFREDAEDLDKRGNPRAKAINLFAVPVLVADLDSGNPQEGLASLISILGAPTVVVASGGKIDERTPKLHVYYRLSTPAMDAESYAVVEECRALMAVIAGGDKTARSVVHGFRVPGSYHRKQASSPDAWPMARILAVDDKREIDLPEALALLREAAPHVVVSRPRKEQREPRNISPVPVDDLFEIAEKMAAEGYHYQGSKDATEDDIELAVGLVEVAAAFYDASGGQPYGLEAFDTWLGRTDGTTSTEYPAEVYWEKAATFDRIDGRRLLARIMTRTTRMPFMWSDERDVYLEDVVTEDAYTIEEARREAERVIREFHAASCMGVAQTVALQANVGAGKSRLMHQILPLRFRSMGTQVEASVAVETARAIYRQETLPAKKHAQAAARTAREKLRQVLPALRVDAETVEPGLVPSPISDDPVTADNALGWLRVLAQALPRAQRGADLDDVAKLPPDPMPLREARRLARTAIKSLRAGYRAWTTAAVERNRGAYRELRGKRRNEGQDVYLYPSHKLADQAATELRTFHPDLKIAVYRGRDYEGMCGNLEAVALAVAAGDPVRTTVCGDPAEGSACPLFSACSYIRNLREIQEADIVVGTHALALHGFPKEVNPYRIVYDEDPAPSLYSEKTQRVEKGRIVQDPFTQDAYRGSIDAFRRRLDASNKWVRAMQAQQAEAALWDDEDDTDPETLQLTAEVERTAARNAAWPEDIRWIEEFWATFMANADRELRELSSTIQDGQIPRVFAAKAWCPGGDEAIERALAIETQRQRMSGAKPDTPKDERVKLVKQVQTSNRMAALATVVLAELLTCKERAPRIILEMWAEFDTKDGPTVRPLYGHVTAQAARALGAKVPKGRGGQYREFFPIRRSFPGMHVVHRKPIDHGVTPVLLLSATAQEDITRVIFPNVRFVAGRDVVNPHARVSVTPDVMRFDRGHELALPNAMSLRAAIADNAARDGLEPYQIGVICPKAFEPLFEAAGYLTLHYGNTSGMNTMQNVAALYLIGGPTLPADASLFLAAAYYGDETIDPLSIWGEHDAHRRRIARAHLLGEMVQSVGRARASNRTADNPVTIYDWTRVRDGAALLPVPMGGIAPPVDFEPVKVEDARAAAALAYLD